MSPFLQCRSLATTAAEKKKITKTILQMSLEHHIVTPLTAMVIENEAGNERMLADSPPQDHTCCSGQCVGLAERRCGPASAGWVQVLGPLPLSHPRPPPAPRPLNAELFLSNYFQESLLPWSLKLFPHMFSKGISITCIPLHTFKKFSINIFFHLI